MAARTAQDASGPASAQEAAIRRPPSQDRSRRRFEAVLSAAEELLATSNFEDISFNDIALKAGISTASVHYLFSGMAAVQLELRKRFDARISRVLVDFQDRLALMQVPTWQEWVRVEAGEARAYYNANRVAAEVLLGPLLDRRNRGPNDQGNALMGASHLEHLRRLFDVPNTPGLEEKFANNCELLEMFWAGSYLSRGFIDDFTFEESMRASIGYLRNFLAETLPMKVDEARARA